MTITVDTGLRALLGAGSLDLPLPGAGATHHRWDALFDRGRRDVALARLVEGHVDAVAILAEAGRAAEPGVLYGVWASRSGGGPRLAPARGGFVLDGTMRFCSGARTIDRALVVADAPDGRLLVDVPVADCQVDEDSWATPAMAGADTLDVHFDSVAVSGSIGGPGWYTDRPGFALGGAGVAAVWCGAASGVLQRVLGHLDPDAHRLAHLGELHAGLAAARALLDDVARCVDLAPGADHALPVATVRSAAERVARDVVERAPRMVGPGPLSRDAGLATALADLGLYVRQHHGERDHAALGALVHAGAAQ